LNEITAIPTEELDLNRVSHSGDIRLRLVVPRSIQVPNTDSVQVAVQIAEQRVTESGPLESKP
jgi:YbbR domain-containing protein